MKAYFEKLKQKLCDKWNAWRQGSGSQDELSTQASEEKTRPWRRFFLVAGALLLLVFLLIHKHDTVGEFLDTTYAIVSRSPQDGIILVETPQVFTRGRLVNDRSSQTEWLTKQLERTSTLLENDRFARPEVFRFAQESLSLSLNKGDSSSIVSRADKDFRDRLTSFGLSAPPLQQFEDANRYRERIRSEIMSTVMDDRHDIEGNNVYRLNFNVSVLPSTNANRLAMVNVELREFPKPEEKEDERRIYVEVLHDWKEAIQADISKIIHDRWYSMSIKNRSFPPDEQNNLDDVLKGRIAIALTEILKKNGNNRDGSTLDPTTTLLNSQGKTWKTLQEIREDPKQDKKEFDKYEVLIARLERTVQRERALERSRAIKDIFKTNPILTDALRSAGERKAIAELLADAEAKCRSFGNLNPFDYIDPKKNTSNSAERPVENTPKKKNGASRSAKESSAPKEGEATEPGHGSSARVEVSCPPLVAALFTDFDIVDALEHIRETKKKPNCRDEKNIGALVAGFLLGRVDPANAKPNRNNSCWEDGIDLSREFHDAPSTLDDHRRQILTRVTSEYILYKEAKTDLRFSPDHPGSESLPRAKARLADLFELTFPKSCAVEFCIPTVEVRGHLSEEKIKDTADSLMNALHVSDRVNAFTYSVAPGKSSLRSDITRTSSLDASSSLKNGPNIPLDANGSMESGTRMIEDTPTIIGFGDWGTNSTEDPRTTRFAWAMFPRRTIQQDFSKRQVPENYLVSAMVSLPGWWKTAHLSVWTCWKSQAELLEGKLCPRDQTPHTSHKLRLPGDARELMQKLRFQVLKYPFIETRPGDLPPILEVGRKAILVIHGGRLWRSPVVMLGNQRAESVEVLPDMQGIVAEFSCIEPTPGTQGTIRERDRLNQEDRPTPTSVRLIQVITSEGTTDASSMAVYVTPFTPRHGYGQGKSADEAPTNGHDLATTTSTRIMNKKESAVVAQPQQTAHPQANASAEQEDKPCWVKDAKKEKTQRASASEDNLVH